MLGYKAAALSTKLLGRPCLECPQTEGRSLLLVGRYGYLWRYSDTQWFAVCHNTRIASKAGFGPLERGEELGRVVDQSEALRLLQVLKVPRNRGSQMKLLARSALA